MMFTTFEEIFAELRSRGTRKRMVAAWGVDSRDGVGARLVYDSSFAHDLRNRASRSLHDLHHAVALDGEHGPSACDGDGGLEQQPPA